MCGELTCRSGPGMVIELFDVVSVCQEETMVEHTIARSCSFEVRKARVVIRSWLQRRKHLRSLARQSQEALSSSDAGSR